MFMLRRKYIIFLISCLSIYQLSFGNNINLDFEYSNEFQLIQYENIISKAFSSFETDLNSLNQMDDMRSTFTMLKDVHSWLPLKYRDMYENATVNSFGNNSSDQCHNDTLEIFIKLENSILNLNLLTQNKWAFEMVDSWGKPPAGFLEGNLKMLGNFDECRNVQVQPYKNNSFKPSYYLASFQVLNSSYYGYLQPTFGLCLPNSCSQKQVKVALSYILNHTFKTTNIKVNVLKNEIRTLDFKAKITIAILGLFGVVILLSSIFYFFKSYLRSNNNDSNLLISVDVNPINLDDSESLLESAKEYRKSLFLDIFQSFSLQKNFEALFLSKSQEELNILHGIRFISTSWVILGHSVLFSLAIMANPKYLLELIRRWSFQPIANATPSVDTFFLLSGLLVSYLTLNEWDRKGKINWFAYYLHRFWRLTPVYMLLLASYTTLSPYWATGPMYNNSLGLSSQCNTEWWKNFLYINNFGFGNLKKNFMACFGWSWYLANDMQFYIISPLLIYPLRRKPLVGIILNVFIIVSSMISTAIINNIYKFGISFVQLGKNSGDFMIQLYVTPYTRIGPYIVGILTGYLLYKHKLKVKINKLVAYLFWMIAFVSALSIFYGPLNSNRGIVIPIGVCTLYNSVFRVVWALCVAWVIIACLSGRGSYINSILSWNGWVLGSRLTYTAYLIHPIIISTFIATRTSSITFDDSMIVAFFLAFISATYLFACIATLTIESPLRITEKSVRNYFNK